MAEYIEIPDGGIGEVSDGYHTFNSLYRQRLILTAALVKAHKDAAWKSWRHEDGQPCFGGGWFIVGFDTPDGGYTYHYEEKDWELFDCVELPVGKHWDGHTDEDVERLLSIPAADVAPVVRCKDCKYGTRLVVDLGWHEGVMCCHGNIARRLDFFCADGAKMDKEETE